MISTWLITKGFKEKLPQVRLVTLAIILYFANFTFLFASLRNWNNPYVFTPMFILTIVASSAILLHLTKNVGYGIAVLKALGGRKYTILASFFIELLVVAAIGSFAGAFIGVSLFAGFSLLSGGELAVFTALGLNSVLFFVIFSIIISSFIGVIFAWKKTNKPIVEAIMHAR